MKKRVLLSFSGGIDSTALLLWYLKKGYSIEAVGFKYQSLHNLIELVSAEEISKLYGSVRFTMIDVSTIFANFSSALLKNSTVKIPKVDQSSFSSKPTIIPFRNSIFGSILVGLAESKGIDTVAMGLHRGRLGYLPDASPAFVQAFRKTVLKGSEKKMKIETPFLLGSKTDIVKWGLKNNLPFNLTRTCYGQKQKACGLCGACYERLEAFKNNNAEDPIIYV